MKIVGNHDEQLLLKTQCANHAKCEYCALKPFCSALSEKKDTHSYTMKVTYDTSGTYYTTGNTMYYEWFTNNSNSKIYSNFNEIELEGEYIRDGLLKLFQLDKFPAILIRKGDDKDASDIQ